MLSFTTELFYTPALRSLRRIAGEKVQLNHPKIVVSSLLNVFSAKRGKQVKKKKLCKKFEKSAKLGKTNYQTVLKCHPPGSEGSKGGIKFE